MKLEVVGLLWDFYYCRQPEVFTDVSSVVTLEPIQLLHSSFFNSSHRLCYMSSFGLRYPSITS